MDRGTSASPNLTGSFARIFRTQTLKATNLKRTGCILKTRNSRAGPDRAVCAGPV